MSFQFFIPSTLLHIVWLLMWNPSFNALHYIFMFQVVSLKSMQFPGDVIVNLAVLLILICWNQCPPRLPKPICCLSFWHSCALTSVTLWRSVLSLVWQSDVIELQSLFCVHWAEWMKSHCWVTYESVLNYCICGTFNFEINLCNICDSSSCNVLKFFMRYTSGKAWPLMCPPVPRTKYLTVCVWTDVTYGELDVAAFLSNTVTYHDGLLIPLRLAGMDLLEYRAISVLFSQS